MDESKLMEFMGPLVTDLGGAAMVASVLVGEEVGAGLGAQAGEARLRQVFTDAGFTSFRRAGETPFNLILEARP